MITEEESDGFPVESAYWNGIEFTCAEHVRWVMLFDALGLAYRIRPRVEQFHKFVFSYYKRKYEPHTYEPPLFLEWQRVFVDVSHGWPTSDRKERASILAERSGLPVAIFRGPMFIPDLKRDPPSVPITLVHGEGDIRLTSRFLLHDGWTYKIGLPSMRSEMVTEKLLSAFRHACTTKIEKQRSNVRFAKAHSAI